jgi:hypothetical protein
MKLLHAHSTRRLRKRAILPRMSAPRVQALLHRLLCLLLALSLAAPSLGLAHPERAGANPQAAVEVETPCPMHAAAKAADDAAELIADADADAVADCCKHDTGMHAGCGEDCRDCAGGCAGLRLPAGLDAAAIELIKPPVCAAPAGACARARPNAPQSNLLRPPALV